jgi:hypothetical protein
MIDRYRRDLDRIDNLGTHGWRDRQGEGTVRNILMGLYAQGRLDREAVLEEMRSRGYDGAALRRLDRFIDKTCRLAEEINAGRPQTAPDAH